LTLVIPEPLPLKLVATKLPLTLMLLPDFLSYHPQPRVAAQEGIL
jgi:hypothetical protein